jgi:hypothetical protein
VTTSRPARGTRWNARVGEASRAAGARGGRGEIAHLDIGELRFARHSLTQTLAGVLFDEGFAGVVIHSKLTSARWLAAFVGRVEFDQTQSLGALDSEPMLQMFVAPHAQPSGLRSSTTPPNHRSLRGAVRVPRPQRHG